MLKSIVTFSAALMAISALGFLLFPSGMLAVVGITAHAQDEFLLRSAGVGLAALVPGVWAARTDTASPAARAVLAGIIVFMLLSSAVDLLAFSQALVNVSAVPSIAIRVLLGAAILWLMRRPVASA